MPMAPPSRKVSDRDAVTYVLLLTYTDAGTKMSDAQHRAKRRAVHRALQREHAKCRLLKTRGGFHDFVSLVWDVPYPGAMRIVEEIERGGFMKVRMLAGLEMYSGE
jgi:uncharacterized protein with GYD domain